MIGCVLVCSVLPVLLCAMVIGCRRCNFGDTVPTCWRVVVVQSWCRLYLVLVVLLVLVVVVLLLLLRW